MSVASTKISGAYGIMQFGVESHKFKIPVDPDVLPISEDGTPWPTFTHETVNFVTAAYKTIKVIDSHHRRR